MKSRPILFNGAMVRALLDGRKTQTRRVIKPQPHSSDRTTSKVCPEWWVDGEPIWGTGLIKDYCPYGVPGDLLWVRETWADVNSEEGPALAYKADSEVISWHDFSRTFGADYGAGPSMDYGAYPGDYMMWHSDLLSGAPDHSWKPSIHMSRWASRLTLRITDVRVQRVKEITEANAIAEGCTDGGCENCGNSSWPTPCGCDDPAPLHRDSFIHLWGGINAKRGFGWETNPWVWAVSFEVINENVDSVLEVA